jgi:hypothetical protein
MRGEKEKGEGRGRGMRRAPKPIFLIISSLPLAEKRISFARQNHIQEY